MTCRIVCIQHSRDCHPGFLGERFTEHGVRLDVRRPYVDGAGVDGAGVVPGTADADALVVLGGPMGACDPDVAWLEPTRALIRAYAAASRPVLGVCLGHQLIAVALGGTVERRADAPMIGLRRFAPNDGWMPAADAITHWNGDVVGELPDSAVVWARTDDGAVQAAQFAPGIWGVQGHPEAGAQIVQSWADDRADAERLARSGIDVTDVARRATEHDAPLRTSGYAFADAFLDAAGLVTR